MYELLDGGHKPPGKQALLFTPLPSGCLRWEPFMATFDPRFLEISRVLPGHREGKTGGLEECRAKDLTELFPENTKKPKIQVHWRIRSGRLG